RVLKPNGYALIRIRLDEAPGERLLLGENSFWAPLFEEAGLNHENVLVSEIIDIEQSLTRPVKQAVVKLTRKADAGNESSSPVSANDVKANGHSTAKLLFIPLFGDAFNLIGGIWVSAMVIS